MIKLLVILALLSITSGSPVQSSIHDVVPRIVGGGETTISRSPWQLALLYYSQHFCGAVAIHPEWALTAAHCLYGTEAAHLSIRAGSSTKSFGGQIIDVVRVHQHYLFDLSTVDYDFALLQLAEPISVQAAGFVALPEPNEDVIIGATATITGWGTLSSDGETPEILHMVQVPVVNRGICERAHTFNNITDRMFCAGDVLNGGRDACQGDGGGPVIVSGRLAGLVSWGSGCGRRNSPGVHARVSSVVEWIYETADI